MAIYPGSFDPVTHGHLDLITRAARLFSEVVVGVGKNPGKSELFYLQERLEMLEPHLRGLKNVRAEIYEGLTIDFALKLGARAIIKGIRNISDLSDELLQANVNLAIGGEGVETILLLASDEHVLTSSTYIKQIVEMGGGDAERIKRLVPRNVAEALVKKLGKK